MYEEDPFLYTNDGEAIKRERICGHFSEPHYRNIRITRMNIDIVAGVGLPEINSITIPTEYADPSIFVSFSKDGGVSYQGRRKATLGKIGERTHRAIVRRLGRARDWVFKIEVISKSKVFLLGASIDYQITGR